MDQETRGMDATLNREYDRQRLLWRSRRGMLELDILLSDFIYDQYERLGPEQLRAFVRLLDYPDAVLFDLLMEKSISSDQEIASVIEKIRTTAAS